MLKYLFSLCMAMVLLFSTVGTSYPIVTAMNDSDDDIEVGNYLAVEQQFSDEQVMTISDSLEMREKHNELHSEITTKVNDDDLMIDTVLRTNLENGEMLFQGEIQEGNESIDVDFEVFLTYIEDEDFGGKLVDRKTNEEYSFDTKVANSSAVPLIVVAVQIARYGVTWAIKKYGDDVVKAVLKSSAHEAAKDIKKSLLDDDGVIIKLFTQKIKGSQTKKDPKSGWSISRDVGKDNAHGGSYWKLMNKAGKRIATLDKNGKVLRK